MLFATIGQGAIFLWMTAAGAVIGAVTLAFDALRCILQAGKILSAALDFAAGRRRFRRSNRRVDHRKLWSRPLLRAIRRRIGARHVPLRRRVARARCHEKARRPPESRRKTPEFLQSH